MGDPFAYEYELVGKEDETSYIYDEETNKTRIVVAASLEYGSEVCNLAYKLPAVNKNISYKAYFVDEGTKGVTPVADGTITEATEIDEYNTLKETNGVENPAFLVVEYTIDGKYGVDFTAEDVPTTITQGFWCGVAGEGIEATIGSVKLSVGATSTVAGKVLTNDENKPVYSNVNFASSNPKVATVTDDAVKNVTYASKDTNVAVVTETGVILGVGEGTTEITATSDGNVVGTQKITVSGAREMSKDSSGDPFAYTYELLGVNDVASYSYDETSNKTRVVVAADLEYGSDLCNLVYEWASVNKNVSYKSYLVDKVSKEISNVGSGKLTEASNFDKDPQILLKSVDHVENSSVLMVEYTVDGKYGVDFNSTDLPTTITEGFWLDIPAESMETAISKVKLAVGATTSVAAQVYPIDKPVIHDTEFSSSNPKVAMVTDEGQILALSEGETYITVKAKKGLEPKQILVTVEGKAKEEVTKVVDQKEKLFSKTAGKESFDSFVNPFTGRNIVTYAVYLENPIENAVITLEQNDYAIGL